MPEQQKQKKPVYKRWWFWVICVVLIVGIIGAASSGSDPQKADNPTPSTNQTDDSGLPSSVENPVEIIKISATDLIAAYEENEVAADDQYKGKTLEVTGRVEGINKDILDKAFVTLRDERSDYTIISVQCYFDDDNLGDIAALKQGNSVSIIGIGDGGTFNPMLKRCNIVN